ncbi:PAAR domain-containing protein [Pseudoduganella sp. HUAS MS19]
MAQAARLNDPIGHSPTMSWLLAGVIAAAAIAVTAVAVVGTGGLAAAAIIGGAAAAGGGIGEVLSTMSWAPKEEVGNITATGSPNVFTNGLRAIRAHLDTAKCDKHTDTEKVATGSGKVFINSMPAARVDDKTTCSATITKGSPNVTIGGGTVQTDEIHAEDLVPTWMHVTMLVVGVGAAFVLAAPAVAIGGIIGGVAGGYGGSMLGGKLFGEGSDGQKWSLLAGSLFGGWYGAKWGSARMAAGEYPPTVMRSEGLEAAAAAEGPRNVPFKKSDLSVSLDESGEGAVYVRAEGEDHTVGLISMTDDGPQFYLDNRVVTSAGESIKLKLEGGSMTEAALEQTIAAHQALYNKPPPSLSGSLADKNLANFRNEFAQLRAQDPVSSDQAIADMAIRRISFGANRIKLGYGDLTTDIGNFDANGLPTKVFVHGRPSK